jgi:toxin ParE1/3/4
MTPFIFHPAAERELDEAATWYEMQQQGLGREFRQAPDHALDAIQQNPNAYSRVKGVYRRYLLRRFPYGVIYRPRFDHIRVLSFSHTHRDPAHWQNRR